MNEEERLKKLLSIYLSFKDNQKIIFKKSIRKKITKKGGCYIIFDKKGEGIYVGLSKGLRGRIHEHKRSDSVASSFRRKISKKYNLKTKEEISKFIDNNCSYIFIEIEDNKERKNFEHFLIALLNPELND